MSLRLLADQCVPAAIVAALRQHGHTVVPLCDCAHVDSPDHVVIAKAQELKCLLLSLNGDFADIVTYPPRDYLGIISLQVLNHPESISPIVAMLVQYFRDNQSMPDYAGKLLIVEPYRIRIRQ